MNIFFRKSPKCTLCVYLSLLVFLSILIIEGVILLPYVSRYKQNQLQHLEKSCFMSTRTLLKTLPEKVTKTEFKKALSVLIEITPIRSLIVKKDASDFVFNLTEAKTDLETLSQTDLKVAWRFQVDSEKYAIIATLDSREVAKDVFFATLRTIGLVFLISISVTLTTLFLLKVSVLNPIVTLRDKLKSACADLEHATKYHSHHNLKNELGELFTTSNHLLSAVEDSILKEKQEKQQKILDLTHFDPITKLPSKRFFEKNLEHIIQSCGEEKNQFALFFISINDLNEINDAYGNFISNGYLKETAKVLLHEFENLNHLGSLAEGQFSVISENINFITESANIAKKILSMFTRPFSVHQKNIISTVNIGIALFPENADSARTLIRSADLTLHRSISKGPNNYQFYEGGMNEKIEFKRSMLADLHQAYQNQDFRLYYQPIVNLKNNKIIALETLIRWHHPEKGMIMPNDFIALAESSGLIIPIGHWILEQACLQLKKWQHEGISGICIAVNLSSIQFTKKLIRSIEMILQKTQLNPRFLHLEITESVVMQNLEEAIDIMTHLTELGIQFSMDDFGTGYSSLNYLQRFPVKKVKIDKSFIKGLGLQEIEHNIVDAIIYLSHSLGLTVLAEGIETESEKQYLLSRGCNEGQGYLFGKPENVEITTKLLKTQRTKPDLDLL